MEALGGGGRLISCRFCPQRFQDARPAGPCRPRAGLQHLGERQPPGRQERGLPRGAPGRRRGKGLRALGGAAWKPPSPSGEALCPLTPLQEGGDFGGICFSTQMCQLRLGTGRGSWRFLHELGGLVGFFHPQKSPPLSLAPTPFALCTEHPDQGQRALGEGPTGAERPGPGQREEAVGRSGCFPPSFLGTQRPPPSWAPWNLVRVDQPSRMPGVPLEGGPASSFPSTP